MLLLRGAPPPPENAEALSIGQGYPGAETLLLDEEGRPVDEPGAAGEMYIRCPSLFSGYWDDPQAPRRVLVPDPLEPRSGQLVYRSGDLAYRDPSGEFYCCGRDDSMVKIRGNRIELGEIECRLTEHPGVTAALVLALDVPTAKRPSPPSSWLPRPQRPPRSWPSCAAGPCPRT
ncbi:AMP-binding protein [Streptomyces sp. NPDC007905]|uniref:AMP-binding protein n=1 Tax=Streptomyces sp. NPDC007905 TaxID=3364788 RepID=UPI0036DFE742